MTTPRHIAATLALLLGVFVSGSAQADQVYWQVGELLGDFFPDADRVTYEEITLTEVDAARLASSLGAVPNRTAWTVFKALDSAGRVVGYAVFDEELGEHRPITFAVQFDTSGRVVRHEIVVYRESQGDGVTDGRFWAQFEGRCAGDSMRDVVAVSGATISSNSMRRGVRRTVEVMAVLLETHPTEMGVERLTQRTAD